MVSRDDRILLANRAFGSIFELSDSDSPVPGEIREIFGRLQRGKSGGKLDYQAR